MTSSDFRARARDMLRGRWGMAVLVTLIAGMLGGLVFATSSSFSVDLDEGTIQNLPEIVRIYLMAALSIGGTLGIVQFILGGTVRLGYCKYLLKLHDGQEGELKDLFSEFDRFRDGFILSLLTSIFIFLWSLLFVIPGIIAAYKYAMAPFLMLENPGMKPREALDESKQLMDGHKLELFFLCLSFIGWVLLSLLTLGIGSFWLNPYMNASYAAFYRNLRPECYAPQEPAPEEGNPWDQIIP